eukprot:3417435-Prymnesium_polylepis.2
MAGLLDVSYNTVEGTLPTQLGALTALDEMFAGHDGDQGHISGEWLTFHKRPTHNHGSLHLTLHQDLFPVNWADL